jgi:hypothetical protein
MYVRFPLSPWNIEDLLIERGTVEHERAAVAKTGECLN